MIKFIIVAYIALGLRHAAHIEAEEDIIWPARVMAVVLWPFAYLGSMTAWLIRWAERR